MSIDSAYEQQSTYDFKQDLLSFIKKICKEKGIEEDARMGTSTSYFCLETNDIKVIDKQLTKMIKRLFKNNTATRNSYLLELKHLIYNIRFRIEMSKYERRMRIILPIEEQVNKLRKSGKRIKEIKEELGDNSDIFEYVPRILYHGSPDNLDIIHSNESAQKGSYVYATDNPVLSLFFAIFRNPSIVKANIKETIDEFGNYKVIYQIDERVEGVLEKIITDRVITIHICDGKQFFKPQGVAYIDREWISKDGHDIVPIDRIHINIKQFFDSLEKRGLVEYSRYDHSKDWETVLDMISRNYSFGLGTTRAKDLEAFDSKYDEFINKYFPEQLAFSKKLRAIVKEVMAKDYKQDNPEMSIDEEDNYKLRYIISFANSFLSTIDDNTICVDMHKITDFLNSNYVFQGES